MCANKRGPISNMTFIASVLGGYAQTSYGAAKTGLIGLAEPTALEGARFNITANCILIGVVVAEAYDEPIPKRIRENLEKKTAIGRPAAPQEIADAVAYAVPDEAHNMTSALMNRVGGLDLLVF